MTRLTSFFLAATFAVVALSAQGLPQQTVPITACLTKGDQLIYANGNTSELVITCDTGKAAFEVVQRIGFGYGVADIYATPTRVFVLGYNGRLFGFDRDSKGLLVSPAKYFWKVPLASSVVATGDLSVVVYSPEELFPMPCSLSETGVSTCGINRDQTINASCRFRTTSRHGDVFCNDSANNAVVQARFKFFGTLDYVNAVQVMTVGSLSKALVDDDKLFVLTADYDSPVSVPTVPGTPTTSKHFPGMLFVMGMNSFGDILPESQPVFPSLRINRDSAMAVRHGRAYFPDLVPVRNDYGHELLRYDSKTGIRSKVLSFDQVGGDYPFIAAIAFLN